MLFKLVDPVSAGANFSHTRFLDSFVIITIIIIIIIIIFFFFFFLSQQPSALRKNGRDLIFTQKIPTGDGGVHCHQVIDIFLLYDTEIKSWVLRLHVTELRHFTTAAPFRARAMPRFCLHNGTRVVASPFYVFIASFD